MSEAMGIKSMWQAKLRKDEVGGGEETDPYFNSNKSLPVCGLWPNAGEF